MTVVEQPYTWLSRIYDHWTGAAEHARWADFAVGVTDGPRTALDLCCGTGRLTAELQARGLDVVGVDRSPAMLEQAQARLPHVPFVTEDLADPQARVPTGFDLVTCSFDSLNYLLGDTARTFFEHAGRALAPEGRLVVDVNSEHKLRHVFGNTHYGDDLDEYAYVWRNRLREEAGEVDFLITLLLRDPDGRFNRYRETHTQRWFAAGALAALAAPAGLVVASVHDDYGGDPPAARTLRETWVLRHQDRRCT